MEFRKPEPDEYESYTKYYKQCLQLSAECSYLALWSYAEEIELERVLFKDLYWQQATWRNRRLWLPPIGEWGRSDWQSLLQEVAPPGTLFGFVPEILANIWAECFPEQIAVAEMRDEWDYIYHVDQQVLLEGQAFSWMRRLCGKFMNSYPYSYSEIEEQDIPEIMAFQQRWMSWNEQSGKMNEELLAEHRTVCKVLNHWANLRAVHGAKLTIGREIAAYIIVEELDDYIISGHILKGNYEYKGVYQAMQHLLYKNHLSKFLVLNAWGDGGMEGLRQAKLNLNPIGYIKKYLITWNG